MDKEEWIEKQLKAYRAKLEKDFDQYAKREEAIRAWIEENKDTNSDLCKVLGFMLDRMMLNENSVWGSGEYSGPKECWNSILALFRGIEDIQNRGNDK